VLAEQKERRKYLSWTRINRYAAPKGVNSPFIDPVVQGKENPCKGTVKPYWPTYKFLMKRKEICDRGPRLLRSFAGELSHLPIFGEERMGRRVHP